MPTTNHKYLDPHAQAVFGKMDPIAAPDEGNVENIRQQGWVCGGE